MLDDNEPLASFENLRVEFDTKDGKVVAVEDISFEIKPQQTVCLVGESGSGKSVSSLSMMRLVEFGGGSLAGGKLIFNRGDKGSIDVAVSNQSQMRQIRGNEIGMIFQEPMTALNPVFTVERQLTEGLVVHKGLSKREAKKRALELMTMAKIPEPERRLKQFPHELSGGMRQRVVIATPAPGPNVGVGYVMATGINYNNVWAALGYPIDVIKERQKKGEREEFHAGGSDASGIVWAVGQEVADVKIGELEEGTAQDLGIGDGGTIVLEGTDPSKTDENDAIVAEDKTSDVAVYTEQGSSSGSAQILMGVTVAGA